MADPDESSKRVARLTQLFNAIIHGRRELQSAADGDRFLEALCAQEDTTKCIERLIHAPGGLSAIAKAFRFSGDSAFLNGRATSFLNYLSDPSLKQLYGGQFLRRVLETIVDPPTFWTTFTEAYLAQNLTDQATQAFAWLLLSILSSPTGEGLPDVQDVAERVTNNESLLKSPSLEVRNLGHMIKHVLKRTSTDDLEGAGGRHDNDHADFRKIKILPTPDEFASTEKPFYRRADAILQVEPENRGLIHLDNQFRLLREDFLGELRSDFQIATGQKRGRKKAVLQNLTFAGLDFGEIMRQKLCSLKLQCGQDIPLLVHVRENSKRLDLLARNKSVLKHQSSGCLISPEGKVLAFAKVDRDEELLARQPPVLLLRIDDPDGFRKVLFASKYSGKLQFVQVDTAVFAYEPILECLQGMSEVPLKEQILDLDPELSQLPSEIAPTKIISTIREKWRDDLQDTLATPKSVKLDQAQAESLIAGLTKKVSLIQGPPGTGKSFIGALIAKVLHDRTTETILVQTYTNHALDQFLEELLAIGIPSDSMVRIGFKSSLSTKHLGISEQNTTYRHDRQTNNLKSEEQTKSYSYQESLRKKTDEYHNLHDTDSALLEYLEFSEDSKFFDAFTVVPIAKDGMKIVARRGKEADKLYLLRQWTLGHHAGVFRNVSEKDFPDIWKLPRDKRLSMRERWAREMLDEVVSDISNLVQKYDQSQERLNSYNRLRLADILGSKRIIGCTTTAAAKYTEELQKAAPGIILVEEAGEILESHTLTAMTPNTRQLVLIGDHKQLRPKVNNYSLTIEKGDGYDLNKSLFERLVNAEVPHITLSLQHRMRPEISSLVRNLTYPELEDAPKTNKRPDLRGFQDNVIFVSHDVPELNDQRITDRRDEGAKSSKENQHEVDMVLKCVRYLGQQGYSTDKMVILTPYLGQLFRLKDTLSEDNDPVLNDLDSFELIRAGLMTPAAGKVSKQPIKISTIDNYQGEESDIVIASLTRSNSSGDIGFMSSPQRVNVLLSRARNALIMIGNAETFTNSRKGKEVWTPLMEQLKKEGHVYDGFPVKCERHPERRAILTSKEAFDENCPDGGCSEKCGTMLRCGQHECPLQCHQLRDHSKMDCKAIITSKCPQNHETKLKCHQKATAICRKCEAEAREKEKKRQRDYLLDQERQKRQMEYARKLAEIQDEMDHQKRILRDREEEQDRKNVLSQQKQDLESLKQQAIDATRLNTARPSKPATTSSADKNEGLSMGTPEESTSKTLTPKEASPVAAKAPKSNPDEGTATSNNGQYQWDTSESKDDWEWQKEFEGAQNDALDELMDMIGLESVKQQFLTIKTKVDTVVRQNVSLKTERFGAALLGNPGTGKTTVARLYAKFLANVGAIPGSYFHETSGSSLANDGVTACKATIDQILKDGGGVFFIDEAYQLVSGNSPGGKAVLDYLLAEIENLTGKIVFVLAGYHKQMEAFFSHNPGIPSRIPIEMTFQDYTDQQLQQILCHSINTKYKRKMRIEDGFGGLYIRIVSRRIGRGRGRDGFGNAREVQNQLAKITNRQAQRLRKERRRTEKKPDDNLLTKEDMIGPEPSSALKNNPEWSRLKKLIGLKAVKDSVQILLDGIQYNYERELEEKPLVQYSLNRCFIGSPGTGKTSVAKLYGRILADIGLLSSGEVVVKSPADFIGSHLGQSENNTKGILASSLGKVLIIDEAYMLSGGSTPDPYKTAVIDTIVAEVQSTPGEDRCVLLLGYKDQMEEMFRDVNPGLARRFPLDSSFVFEDFSDSELRQILDLKLKDVGFNATDQAKAVAMDVLKRARNRPNFGNAGEVDIILDKAKSSHQKHLSAGKSNKVDTFEAIDFDPDFDRGDRAATNLPLLFQDVVGCEDLVKQLQGYQTTASNMKALGMDPREQVPFNFLFKGPPGTGKTTTAQKMGKVFYDMGFLAQAKVVECSATDLIGQYVGQTGPKVQKLLEKALGKVLFIDEAYRKVINDLFLLAEGHFSTEAMDELVDCLTKPKYQNKLVTILAGYDEDMDRLMSINPGLSSRFPESVVFKHFEPKTCLELLTKTLGNLQKNSNGVLDLSVIAPLSTNLEQTILDLFQQLSESNSWGNARDVKGLAKSMFAQLISPPSQSSITSLTLTDTIIIDAMEAMLAERSRRNEAAKTTRSGRVPNSTQLPQARQQPNAPSRPSANTRSQTSSRPPANTAEQKKPPSKDVQPTAKPAPAPKTRIEPSRDAGVSDEDWHQLLLDKQAAIAREKELERLRAEKIHEEQRIADLKKAELAALVEEERRRLEQNRIQAEIEKKKRDEELAALERERKKEIAAQKKLTELGVCVNGFEWIKQAGGYRCAAGGHFVSSQQLGL